MKKFDLNQLAPPKGTDLLCRNLANTKYEYLSAKAVAEIGADYYKKN